MPSLNIATVNEIFEKLDIEEADNYSVFIETGTNLGHTIVAMQPYFQSLHTIELSEHYHQLFEQRKQGFNLDNISTYLGDSSVVIRDILQNLTDEDTCVFWLDGHWSSGDTAQGDKDCPLIEECSSIDELYKGQSGVILVDDYRLFGTKYNEDWTEITEENILNCFSNFNVVKKVVHEDSFCLLIQKNAGI